MKNSTCHVHGDGYVLYEVDLWDLLVAARKQILQDNLVPNEYDITLVFTAPEMTDIEILAAR